MAKQNKGAPILRLLVFAVIVGLVIMILSGYTKSNSLKKQNRELEQQVKDITAEINETKDLLNAGDSEIIERYARDKLGYGEPGEKIYQNISGD